MPRAVIFDVDGTLIDSNDLHAQCWVETFQHFNVEVPFGTVRGQIGKGGDQLLPTLLPADLLDAKGEAIEAYRSDLFVRSYISHVRPFPGVQALFKRIRAEGAMIVLASSGRKAEVDRHIEMLGIVDLIEASTTSDDAESSKPAPDIFEAAMKKLRSVTERDAVVVGDTPYDAQAASKAGLKTIGLLCGGFPEEELRSAGCIAVFRDPEQLLADYDSSPFNASA